LIHARRVGQPLCNIDPRHEQVFRRWCGRIVSLRVFEARLCLVEQLLRLRRGFFLFNNDEGQVAVARQVVEEGRRSGFLGQRDDGGLI
jgi:hypothetical protein